MPAYISEADVVGGAGNEFVEIAVTTGTDMSGYSIYVYAADGTVSAGPLSLGSLQNTVAGRDIYVVDDVLGLPDIAWTDSIALVEETGTVLQFISFDGNTTTASEGPADGETSTNIGRHGNDNSLQSNDGGSSYSTQTQSEGTVPCYALGTKILTPDGPRLVETLHPGDLVMTRDSGPQAIRLVSCQDQALECDRHDRRPILIKAGALGRDLPAHDLIVSPQHRVLVGGAGQLDGLFDSEAFAAAKSLTSLPGIRHMQGKDTITWIHFACDRHEVVTANGCLSESLLLGPMVVNGLTAAERDTVVKMFGPAPAPEMALNGPPARDCLKVDAVRRQITKHLKEEGRRLAKEIKKWDRDLALEKHESERLREAS